MAKNSQNPAPKKPATATTQARQKGVSRRSVLKMGALVSAALPLVLTLTPTEARAQDSS